MHLLYCTLRGFWRNVSFTFCIGCLKNICAFVFTFVLSCPVDGFDKVDPTAPSNDLKNQVAGLLTAVAYMKVPLIVVNCLIVAVEVLFG